MTATDSTRPSDAPIHAPSATDATSASIVREQLSDYKAGSAAQPKKDTTGEQGGVLDFTGDIYGSAQPAATHPGDSSPQAAATHPGDSSPQAAATHPGDSSPPPASAASAKPESRSLLGRLEHWGHSTLQSAEHAGTSALHTGEQLVTSTLSTVEQVGSSALTSAEQASSVVGQKLANAGVLAGTLGSGIADAAVETVKGVSKVQSVVAHAAEATGQWAYDHPGQAAAIVVGAAAVVTAEVFTGGLATGAIMAAAPTLLELGGAAVAANAIVTAGEKVVAHNDVGTILNQENHTPAEVSEAQKRLKEDTGEAIVTGTLVVGGAALVKRLATAGEAGTTAVTTGTETAGTVAKGAETAGTDTVPAVAKGPAAAGTDTTGTSGNGAPAAGTDTVTPAATTEGPAVESVPAQPASTGTVETLEVAAEAGIVAAAAAKVAGMAADAIGKAKELVMAPETYVKAVEVTHKVGDAGQKFAPVAAQPEQQPDPEMEDIQALKLNTLMGATENMAETDKPIQNDPAIPDVGTWQQSFVQAHGSAANQQNTADLFWKEFQTISENVLKKVDASGHVTKEELTRAIQTDALKGDESAVAAALYKTFDQIHGAPGRSGQAKISVSDIAALSQASLSGQNGFSDLDSLSYWAVTEGNIKKFSARGSDFLTQTDINAASARSDLPAPDRAKLQELSANFSSISAGGKIGKPEIDSYYKKFLATDNNYRLGNFLEQDMESVSLSQQAGAATHKLFADQTDPLKSITAESVHQGLLGNCAFDAALAGLAAVRPADIVPMISHTASGSFDVHLPGVKGKSFTVTAPTDAEIGLFSPSSPDGYWPVVLNKAYGEKVFAESSGPAQAQMASQTADEWAAGDGDQIRAIQALTDHQVDANHISNLSDSQLASKLLNGWNDRRVMVLNTPEGDHTGPRTVSGFLANHALTITNLANVNGQIEVTVRNPLALGNNRPDGTMQISLQTLRKNFDGIFIETSKPL